MKFVYALISNEDDYYAEECVLSILSLKRNNPDAEVFLITDSETYSTFYGFRSKLIDLCDRIKIVNFKQEVNNVLRSRLLKTSLRRFIKGKFIYLDCDTIVADSLDELKCLNIDIGMVLDKHISISGHPLRKDLFYKASKANCRVGFDDKHFNSGVIFVGDSEKTDLFFDSWHKLYIKYARKCKIYSDQVSLNEQNCLSGGVISELEGIWNVQINYGIQYISDSKIIHYLSYRPNDELSKYYTTLPFKLCNIELFNSLKENNYTLNDIESIINYPRKALKYSAIIPNDCITYNLLLSNHMRILKVIYIKFRCLYIIFEKLFGYIFKTIYIRL